MPIPEFFEFFNQFSHRHVLFHDGRILGVALAASGMSKNAFIKALDYTPAGMSGQLAKKEYTQNVLGKGQVPDWQYAQACCKVLGIAPHELIRHCEEILPYPDFIVEAEIAYVENRMFAGLSIETGSRDFFATIANHQARIGHKWEPRLNMRRIEAFNMVLMAAGKVEQPEVLKHYDRPVQVWGQYYHDVLEQALSKGDIGQHKRERLSNENAQRKHYEDWQRGVRTLAEELAMAGKDKDFVAAYGVLAARCGAAVAREKVMADPESYLPMRNGWRMSAHMLLKSGQNLAGEAVLSQFCISFAQMLREKDKHAEALGRAKDAQDDWNAWHSWGRAPSTRIFMGISAQRQLIAHVLGDAVGVSRHDMQEPTGIGAARGLGL